MKCPGCNSDNEPGSRYCGECGRFLEDGISPDPAKSTRVYLYALLLVPVLVLAAGAGYYKYILPKGIAAVVNGEEIGLAELDAEVARTVSPGQADSRLRYQVLNSLITERLVVQEAHKAGMAISREEIDAALRQARTASGQSEAEFDQEAAARYGSRRKLEEILGRRLLMNKFLAENVLPAGADVRTARMALDQWLQERTAAAAVRITLAEQWSGAGCGCCTKTEAAAKDQPVRPGCRMAQAGPGADASPASQAKASNAGKAAAAGLQYWHEQHGPGNVTAKVTDLGCHMQVDIIQGNKILGSLRYQAGAISEL